MTQSGQAPRPLVAGNWKMNGLKSALTEVIDVRAALAGVDAAIDVDAMICPPSTLVMVMAEVLRGCTLALGGQDCHAAAAGAHTGDVSAEMLADAGAVAVIVGHSERRADYGERDRDVAAKAAAGHRAGLTAIVCVGETAGQRQAGLTIDVVNRQLQGSLPALANSRNTVIAYEPVWAIGTGLTPSIVDVAEVHAAIRAWLIARLGDDARGMRILYGGSVKPSNARELMGIAHVNGALVGGASLTARDFLAIIRAYSKS